MLCSPSLPRCQKYRSFYREGIRSVGVDPIIADAEVTRATFYRHYTAKDDLVVAYLEAADRPARIALQEALLEARSRWNLPTAS
ncbi:MAG: TetR/AcrR family transcriptional regulator [Thermomicrobiales bacterium]